MRVLSCLFLCSLAACDSPSPAVRWDAHYETRLAGVSFSIWQRDDRIEIIRHGFARPSEQARLKGLMIKAAETSTGCALRQNSIDGDTGVLRARLECD